jgi:hypothetical protein
MGKAHSIKGPIQAQTFFPYLYTTLYFLRGNEINKEKNLLCPNQKQLPLPWRELQLPLSLHLTASFTVPPFHLSPPFFHCAFSPKHHRPPLFQVSPPSLFNHVGIKTKMTTLLFLLLLLLFFLQGFMLCLVMISKWAPTLKLMGLLGES